MPRFPLKPVFALVTLAALAVVSLRYPSNWLAAAVAAYAIIMVLFVQSRPSPEGRFRFSLRTLMLAVLLLACGFCWFGLTYRQARKQEAAVEAFGRQALGYDYDTMISTDGPGVSISTNVPRNLSEPQWLLQLLGLDFFHRVVYADGRFPTAEQTIALADLSHLRYLSLTGVELTPELMDSINRMDDLEYLSLSATNLTDDLVSRLTDLPRLVLLTLSVEPASDGTSDGGISSEGLRSVSRLHSIRVLELMGNSISDEGLVHLQEMPELVNLSISDNPGITDAGLAHLAKMTQLETLRLPGMSGITDEGLASLSGLSQLKTLVLSGSNVTDAGLQHLESLKELRVLQLQGSRTTTEGMAGLRESLPNLNQRGRRGIPQGRRGILPGGRGILRGGGGMPRGGNPSN